MTKIRRGPAAPTLKEQISELAPTTGRTRSNDVHRLLRDLIVNGQIPPGTILSQQGLSRELNVSRTPIREALRKLQEEELIEGRPNYRAKVTPFNLSQLETLYSARIFMEPLAVSHAVPKFTKGDVAYLAGQVDKLGSRKSRADFGYWLKVHREFHLRLVAGSSPSLLSTIEANCERSDRYLHLFHEVHPAGWWMGGQAEHARILKCCEERDALGAMHTVALHIGRTALDLAAQLAPKSEPRFLMGALEIMTRTHTEGTDLGVEGGGAQVHPRRLVGARSGGV